MVFSHLMNRRKHERYSLLSSNVYISDPSTNHKISDAVIHNCSLSGLCIITVKNLSKDQTINIKQSGLTKHQRAIVRWTEELEDSNQRVGVELM